MMMFTRICALAACLAVGACDSLVHVDATSNVPARYSSVLVTVEKIWFNESATAVTADTNWQKAKLDETVTLDLVDVNGGAIARIASELKVPVGTYRQIRLFLAKPDAKLRDSAEILGADYNNQVTWFDEDGIQRTAPLEVLNADQGIGIELEIEVEEGSTDEAATVQLLFDAARDLTQFTYSDETGFLLNPTLRAFDAGEVGTVRGTLNVFQGGGGTGRPDIEVTAQKLDETLGRRVIVGSASVSRTGSFVLYPLPLDEDEDEDTEYDLVIHGPRIQTIVIRKVPVTKGAPASAAPLALGVIAPEAAESFEADIREDSPVVPRGARIGFYQTLPDGDEPYLINVAAVDPVSGRFAQPVLLSRAERISYGTYGNNFTLRSGTPEEGAARYAVAALSPHYGYGALAETLLRPASDASDTAEFSVPAIGMPAAAVPGTISATLTIDRPGRYDRGVLMVTHEGALVTMARLNEVLQQSSASALIDITEVPAGTETAVLDSGLYHLEAWTWDSDDPEDTFERHRGVDALDLRATATATAAVTIH